MGRVAHGVFGDPDQPAERPRQAGGVSAPAQVPRPRRRFLVEGADVVAAVGGRAAPADGLPARGSWPSVAAAARANAGHAAGRRSPVSPSRAGGRASHHPRDAGRRRGRAAAAGARRRSRARCRARPRAPRRPRRAPAAPSRRTSAALAVYADRSPTPATSARWCGRRRVRRLRPPHLAGSRRPVRAQVVRASMGAVFALPLYPDAAAGERVERAGRRDVYGSPPTVDADSAPRPAAPRPCSVVGAERAGLSPRRSAYSPSG